MEQQTITMGQVTYELRRVYHGSRPLSELVTERLIRSVPAAQPAGGGRDHAV